jgi:hypothetical protein
LGELSQIYLKLLLTINTRQANVVLDPLLDPRLFSPLLFHGQDIIESVQGSLGYYASKDLGLPLPTTRINNRTPRHILSDFGKDGPLLPQSVIWGE